MCEECNNASALGLLAQTAVIAISVTSMSRANYDAVTVGCMCWHVLAVVYDNDSRHALGYAFVHLLHALA